MEIEVTGLADAEAGFKPLEVGPYTLVVSAIPEKKLNKEGSAYYLWWIFDVEGQPNRQVRTATSLQEHALFSLKGLIQGLEKNNGVALETSKGFNATECVGLKVGANLEIDGEYNKIASYFVAD